jgi:hypothetical protein
VEIAVSILIKILTILVPAIILFAIIIGVEKILSLRKEEE